MGRLARVNLFSLFRFPVTTSFKVPSPPALITKSTSSSNSSTILIASLLVLVYLISASYPCFLNMS